MKNTKINDFNKKGSLLIISGWPKKRELYSKGVCAVSSFTKNTITALQKENPGRKIVVFTMQTNGNEVYEENGILVIRCFKRNSPLSYLSLLKQIIKFNKPKDVLIEFEFASFGDTLTTSLMAPFVFVLFLLRKNIFLVIHQVLFDIRVLSAHIGVEKNNPKLKFLNLGLKWFYFMLTLPAKKVVVLEEEFKKRLSKVANPAKIFVIPHGVDTDIRSADRLAARKKLGIGNDEFVLLYFGYLTWYKGVDFLIETLQNVNSIKGKKVRLLIAGGPSFTQQEKKHYQFFFKSISKSIKISRNIILTGFVDEKDITPIFETSNLVVLPYRTFMSSSGPLSLAISHKKPFILSKNLKALTDSSDINETMKLSEISHEDLFFKLTRNSLIKSIEKSLDPRTQSKLVSLSTALNKARSFENISKVYNKLLWNENVTKAEVFDNLLSINKT